MLYDSNKERFIVVAITAVSDTNSRERVDMYASRYFKNDLRSCAEAATFRYCEGGGVQLTI